MSTTGYRYTRNPTPICDAERRLAKRLGVVRAVNWARRRGDAVVVSITEADLTRMDAEAGYTHSTTLEPALQHGQYNRGSNSQAVRGRKRNPTGKFIK
jgi:hypothetical protein